MDPKEAAQKALEGIRDWMDKSNWSELTTLRVFSDLIGSEVDCWEARIEELESDLDQEEYDDQE